MTQNIETRRRAVYVCRDLKTKKIKAIKILLK